MKRLLLKFAPILLAFLIGISAKAVWDKRQQVQHFWSNLFLNYQD
jgi:tryptophan-rich sensory protein